MVLPGSGAENLQEPTAGAGLRAMPSLFFMPGTTRLMGWSCSVSSVRSCCAPAPLKLRVWPSQAAKSKVVRPRETVLTSSSLQFWVTSRPPITSRSHRPVIFTSAPCWASAGPVASRPRRARSGVCERVVMASSSS